MDELNDIFGTTESKINNAVKQLTYNLAIVILCFASIIILLTTIFDIEFQSFIDIKFAGNAIMVSAVQILASEAMLRRGASKGKLDDGYEEEHKKYVEIREKIIKQGCPNVDEFCKISMEEDLKNQKISLLSRYIPGITYEYYDQYISMLSDDNIDPIAAYYSKGMKVVKNIVNDIRNIILEVYEKQIKKLKKINKLSPHLLTRNMMLTEEGEVYKGNAIGNPPEKILRKGKLTKYCRMIITGMFTASISVPIILHPQMQNVLPALIKLFFLFVSAGTGYYNGYTTYSEKGKSYLISQRNVCEEYLAYINKCKNAEEAAEKPAETDLNNDSDKMLTTV